jgi:hypothetical protein
MRGGGGDGGGGGEDWEGMRKGLGLVVLGRREQGGKKEVEDVLRRRVDWS